VLPDQSVFWVIGFVLLLTVLLDRLLLRPITRVTREREAMLRSARELADESRARAQAASDEFEAKTRAARAEVYRQMDDKRRAALAARTELLGDTRREVERTAADASARLSTQAEAARERLERDADALATTIVERVLGRKAS